jgi:hypothetical protein
VTRRQLLATATAAVVLASVVIGSFIMASPRASPTASSKKAGGSIVVIGTGGLSWSDVSPQSTPTLWSLLRDGATAALTVRSIHANTCPVDAWLTLSAGEQAGDSFGGGGGGGDGLKPPCRALPAQMTPGKVPHWSEYRAAAGGSRFDASLGLLGDQIAAHGGCVQAVGPGAALGAARASGMVVRYQQYDDSITPSALATCPLTLVDVGPVRDPSDVNPKDELRPTTSRAQQVAAIDARVAAVLKVAPAGADFVVASLADAGGTEGLRMIAVSGPNFGGGTLESSSTRQPGLVQLTDLTPTILEHLGIPALANLGGTPLRFVPAQEVSDHSAADRLTTLLDYDQASHNVRSLVKPFFYGWVLLQLALYLSATVLWRLGWGTGGQRLRLLKNTRQVAILAATVPVSTFLANLLPWWRFPVPMVALVAAVALFAVAISSLALLGPWRTRLLGPLVVVCTATVTVLTVDLMTGSRLQLSSLMGLQPVIGGRFYGMGNVTFALFATATLMLCAFAGDHLLTMGQPRSAAAAVAAIGMTAVIVDASPSLGSDLGGPPALLPGVIVLVLAILNITLTWRRAAAIGAGIGAFLVLLGLLDWFRPADSRSHLGRFVQTVLSGGGWDIIVRKISQSITLWFANPLSLLIPVVLVLFTFILWRPDRWAGETFRQSFARVQLLRSGLIAITVMWVIGATLNDSGAAIPAVGATLACPLVIAIVLRTLEDQRVALPVTSRASRHRR